jgi:hypothetical protein
MLGFVVHNRSTTESTGTLADAGPVARSIRTGARTAFNSLVYMAIRITLPRTSSEVLCFQNQTVIVLRLFAVFHNLVTGFA